MKMLDLTGAVRRHRRFGWVIIAAAVLAWMLLYRLGSLVGGLSQGEESVASAPIGWHGLYAEPLYLPLQLARSIVFFTAPGHGQVLTRLPGVILGALAVISFAILIRWWYGSRIAALATAMLATSAWTLHVSRFASFDVVYLWALPTLLLGHFMLQKYYRKPLAWFGALLIWGWLIYIPGMVWFVAVDIFMQRRFVAGGWTYAKAWWQRVLYIIVGLAWLPLLGLYLSKPGHVRAWLGLPRHFDSLNVMLKHFVGVPTHLFIRGPESPQLWLGRAPIMDIFALAVCVLGIYFYLSHRKSHRSRYLAVVALLGFILIGIGGPVTLSLMVPLLYVAVATGLAYLLSQWLRTFPNNPLARGLGLGLVICAVALSCLYNYRAYFIAWPHTEAARATFQYHRHP